MMYQTYIKNEGDNVRCMELWDDNTIVKIELSTHPTKLQADINQSSAAACQ